MPEQRYATQDELATIDRKVSDAVDSNYSVGERARVGADMNFALRSFHNTPAVVELRRRLFTDLLAMAPDALAGNEVLKITHPPEPWHAEVASALAPAPAEQYVMVLYGEGTDETATGAYVIDGTNEQANVVANKIGELQRMEFDLLRVDPLPAALTAEQVLDKVRHIVDRGLYETEIVAELRALLDLPAQVPVKVSEPLATSRG